MVFSRRVLSMEKWNSAGKKKKSNPAAAEPAEPAEPAQSDVREDFSYPSLYPTTYCQKF